VLLRALLSKIMAPSLKGWREWTLFMGERNIASGKEGALVVRDCRNWEVAELLRVQELSMGRCGCVEMSECPSN
jgi:hypothetical protein